MYLQLDDDTIAISVNDWMDTGLTYKQYNHDLTRGFLKIAQRGINGNTLIDIKSIRRQDRLRIIQAAFGKIEDKKNIQKTYQFEVDPDARSFFVGFRNFDGTPLDKDKIEEYVNQASILCSLRKGLSKQIEARAKINGKRLKMGEFWQDAAEWYLEQVSEHPCKALSNARSVERAFKKFFKGNEKNYESLLHGNQGNDSSRVVSAQMARLFLAIWRKYDKPFITVVHKRYIEFVSGTRIIYDVETGEQFNPVDFRYKGRAREISEKTIYGYLKEHMNFTSVYADRNGNFDYMNTKRPKHKRKIGQYALSKISMDDVALSRVSKRGWVYKYIAVDVRSGYIFRPDYVIGKPTTATVINTFRNMFCELLELGLPMPGELEVEHFLMQDIKWLDKVFPFVRFAKSATEKRVEHTNRQFKYGVSKEQGHTRGRWYSQSEAHKSIRYKVKGDFVEPEYDPQTVIADDLDDIQKYNNELHPLQKTFPGMTRRDVLIKNFNPKLKPIEPWYLWRFIGNETPHTTIRNNDCCTIQGMDFWLKDFNDLKKLSPNNYEVTAYWLPEDDGSIIKAYLYQNDEYVFEVYNSENYRYNEFAYERDGDEAEQQKMLHQNKRTSKFDKAIKDHRSEIPKIEYETYGQLVERENITPEIVETVQPKNYDGYDDLDEDTDWAKNGINSL